MLIAVRVPSILQAPLGTASMSLLAELKLETHHAINSTLLIELEQKRISKQLLRTTRANRESRWSEGKWERVERDDLPDELK